MQSMPNERSSRNTANQYIVTTNLQDQATL